MEGLFGEEHLGDVDDAAGEHHRRPDDEDADERARVADHGEPLREVAPAASADRPVALEQPPRDERDEQGREGEGDRVDGVGQVRAGERDEHPAEEGPERGRRRVDELHERVRAGQLLPRDEVRQPGEDRRAEEAVPDPGDRREDDDPGGRVDERQRREDGHAARGRSRSSGPCARAGRRAGRTGAR